MWTDVYFCDRTEGISKWLANSKTLTAYYVTPEVYSQMAYYKNIVTFRKSVDIASW